MTDLNDEQALDQAIQHQQAGRLAEAEVIYRRLLGKFPSNPDLLHLMGILAFQVRRLDVAEGLFRRALALNPNSAHFHGSLAQTLHQMGRLEDAIASLRHVITLRGDNADTWELLGSMLFETGQADQGSAAYRRAMSLSAAPAEVGNNLSAALLRAGRVEDAIAILEQTLTLAPELPHTHYNLAQSLLLKGDFTRGWREHEWRRKVKDRGVFCQDFPQPMWTGDSLNGKTLLLHAEQGFGDAIQFIRCIPQVVEHAAGRVILQVPTELETLFQQVKDVEVISREQKLPEFDSHCPLMSLPTLFDTIPAEIPYLRADAELSARWRERLQTGRRNIGLCWAGRPTHVNDSRRSMSFDDLAPLANFPNTNFISLQKHLTPSPGALGEGRDEGIPWLTDWTDELKDFSDTAALIDNLDLIITVDTAIAHLASAMDKRVYLFLPFAPDWRWMLDRDDSPWYPTMKLFRQRNAGEWETPVCDVIRALAQP